jgi:hypothetical protein
LLLVLIAIAAGVRLAAAGFVVLVRQLAEPPVGPKTLDLGA